MEEAFDYNQCAGRQFALEDTQGELERTRRRGWKWRRSCGKIHSAPVIGDAPIPPPREGGALSCVRSHAVGRSRTLRRRSRGERAPVKLGVGWKRKWPPDTLGPRSGRGETRWTT